MKKTILAGAAFAFFGMTTSVQAKASTTIYDGFLKAGNPGELSTFVELMNEVFSQEDLQRIFGGGTGFTVFAPSNAAFEDLFAALSDDELAGLKDLNTGQLEKLLRYHVTQGHWRKPGGALRMLDDSVAHTYGAGSTFKIDEAAVEGQTRYQNGVVATINAVISPPQTPLPGESPVGATSHSNDLFYIGATSVSGTFGEHMVTNGQPYGDVLFTDGNKLIINAGRKKSSPPASWFIAQSGLNNTPATGGVIPTCAGGATTPSGLNFAQLVTEFNITVDGKSFSCPNVLFGQGSASGNNNWWVGQDGARFITNVSGMVLSCTVSDGSSCLLSIGGCLAPDEFPVSAICTD